MGPPTGKTDASPKQLLPTPSSPALPTRQEPRRPTVFKIEIVWKVETYSFSACYRDVFSYTLVESTIISSGISSGNNMCKRHAAHLTVVLNTKLLNIKYENVKNYLILGNIYYNEN